MLLNLPQLKLALKTNPLSLEDKASGRVAITQGLTQFGPLDCTIC